MLCKMILSFLANLYLVDLSSFYYKPTTENIGLVSSLPLWHNCPSYVQKLVTYFYSIAQIAMSYILLSDIHSKVLFTYP